MADITVPVWGYNEPPIDATPLPRTEVPQFNEIVTEDPIEFLPNNNDPNAGDIWSFLQNLGSGAGDLFSRLLGGGGGADWLSTLIPSLVSGISGLDASGRYGDMAERASRMASPVSQETREWYQDRLRRMQEDPTGYLESNPEFMASRRLGEGALFAKNNAMGMGDSGKATTDQLRFLSDLSSRFLSQERKDLMNMGGFQFSPAAGAEMLMKGLDQELVARQQALDAIMYPLGARNGPGGGTPGSGSPTSMDNILRTILSGKTPAGMSASQVGSIIAQLPNQIRNFLMLGPNGAPGLEEIYGNVRGGDWTSWYNPDQGGGYTFPGPGMEEEYGIGQGGDWGYIWNMPDFSYDDFINSLTGSGE